jgi:hypothetical protein
MRTLKHLLLPLLLILSLIGFDRGKPAADRFHAKAWAERRAWSGE